VPARDSLLSAIRCGTPDLAHRRLRAGRGRYLESINRFAGSAASGAARLVHEELAMNVKRLGPSVSHSPCWCWRQASPLRGCRPQPQTKRPRSRRRPRPRSRSPRRPRPPGSRSRSTRTRRALMDLALNNAKNISDYYKAKGQDVVIEIVHLRPRPAHAAHGEPRQGAGRRHVAGGAQTHVRRLAAIPRPT